MFNKLFGAKKQEEAPVDIAQANTKIQEQVDNINMRIKKIENDSNQLKQQAIEYKKKKNDRSALHCLRKAKMLEKELAKLEGQSVMLEQQALSMQSAQFDQGVFQDMKTGAKVMEKIQKDMNIDEMEKIKDDIQDHLDQQEEINEFFAENANKDKDELMDELEEMMAMEQMEDLDVGTDFIAAKEGNKVPGQAEKAQEQP